MKRFLPSAALIAVAAATFAPAAHAQNDEWWRNLDRHQARRDVERASRDIERKQRIAERERAMGIERPHPTIDPRYQRLPVPPRGHEWQQAPNGDFMLVNPSGIVVEVVRNIQPPPPVAP